MLITQLGASQVVCQVLGGRNLNQALEAYLRSAPKLSPQQRAALRDLCFGTLRFYRRLDWLLRQLLHQPAKDAQLRCLLLVALYQLLYSKSAAHAIVDHAVQAVRKRNAAASGLVNAVLRNFLRNRDTLLAAAERDEEARYAYPQWWIDAIKSQYGAKAEAILLAGNQHPPMTLRVNNRRITAVEYLQFLAQHEIAASIIAPDAILLGHPLAVDKLPGFFDGLVSVQDAGAQYAAYLLDVHDGMRVLDACSAPGGKSAHLLESAQIELLALDKDEQRLAKVRENVERLQLRAELRCGDAAQPEGWWDGKPFQRILADVPCSASGVVRRHPDIKWLRRPEDIDGFAQQQLQILKALWRLLASDGKLLYATCSVFARENQQVIDEFKRQQDDARSIPLSVANMNEGQLLPDEQHDGFYYALLHKSA
ncbi:MAG: 16S rRNA (cytosine(967)-C(5))-methyltransferase RsmB [Sideroxydans sp.]|nr:16S rRNA (cytosine(967)-C(5))-methyltransferase RsmB [Sideroxydans sp.]